MNNNNWNNVMYSQNYLKYFLFLNIKDIFIVLVIVNGTSIYLDFS